MAHKEPLRILTHPMHTGYDYELAKTGHDFVSAAEAWDCGQRPKPDNWTLAAEPEGGFHAGLLCSREAFEWMSRFPIPLIFVVHGDSSSGRFPPEVESRVSMVVFSSSEVAGRTILGDSGKAYVIEHSVDSDVYRGYRGDGKPALAVGNLMRRPEKGLDSLLEVHSELPIDLVGAANEGIPCAIGHAPDYQALLEAYRAYKVYLNPSRIVSTSVIEAMVTGMPVVSFPPINYQDLMADGSNCLIAESPAEAAEKMRKLIADAGLRAALGGEARSSAGPRFRSFRFQAAWNSVLESVSSAH